LKVCDKFRLEIIQNVIVYCATSELLNTDA